MTSVNISTFRKNLYGYVKNVIDFNEIVEVTSKNGKVIVMSEEDYTGLMETVYLMSSHSTAKDIKEGLETNLKECVSEKDVEW